MKMTCEKVINTALQEVGYLEKKSNQNLDNKTANAGSANYTKYGRDMGCNGYAWCDAYVDWCFVKAYGKENAKRLLGGFSNYTPTSAGYFKKMNRYYEVPQKGDIIFFKNAERICHTGLVTRVLNGTVYTVEGNTSKGSSVIRNGGGVYQKQYSISNPRIDGYGRPDYSVLSTKVDDFGNLKETAEYKKIRDKIGLTESTMRFLCKHRKADILLKKIANAI